MITWKETMSTGIEKIDTQHKMLFAKFNELESALSSSARRAAAGDVLDFLQFYAIWHFDEEEKEMEERRCAVLADNRRAHLEFKQKFNSFYEEWQQGNMTPQLAQQVYQELEDWLVYHVIEIDSNLRFE